jgi:tetratricopeptide (TPR) repeat protein
MVAAAQHAGATAIVASLGQNLRDFPPGASRHRPGLSHSERAQWRAAVDEARRLAAADHCEAALRRLDEAAGIDSRPALLHFARAQCLDVLGRTEQARAAYRLASDLDEIPLGAPSAMNEVMRDVAEELHTRFVDVAAAFRSGSEDGIPGDDLFLDHIHPTISGHALVGRALARELTGRPARDGPDPRVLAAAMPDLEKRVFFARLPLYLILRWYDAAAREGAKISRRFPDVHVEQVIERLREEDPAPDPTDVYAAPS